MNELMHSRRHCSQQGSRPACRPATTRRGERGLTLVELMVAVLVASVLIGFVFDIQGRMSNAFRSQTSIGSLQQGIRAAVELIARDARLAGFMAPNGIRVSSDFGGALPELTPGLVQNDGSNNFSVPAMHIANNPDARGPTEMQPDRIHMFYADPNPEVQAVVTSIVGPTDVMVDNGSTFQAGDLVLFSRRDPTPRPHPLGPDLPLLTNYFACLVKVTGVSGNQLTFDASGAPFNTAGNEHCFNAAGAVEPAIFAGSTEKTQVFPAVARAYRIDTSSDLSLRVAALQRSETGGLDGPWQEIGIGIVDLQISQRYVEEVADADNLDNDGDPRADWYTSDVAPGPDPYHRTQISIGLVARTPQSVEGVSARRVPVLTCGDFTIVGCSVANNPFGDAADGPKNLFLPEYNPENEPAGGEHVYRQSTTFVDIRNLEVSY
jgi:prepilin-type N-terminal cleavage/methylation domain-containing protein